MKKALILDLDKEKNIRKLNDLLSDDSISIKSIQFRPVFCGSNCILPILILYEEAEEILKEEKEELKKLNVLAEKIIKDDDFKKLKNNTQRSLYLLEKYNIISTEASKLIELINVRKVISEK